jgi:hypothetical protein
MGRYVRPGSLTHFNDRRSVVRVTRRNNTATFFGDLANFSGEVAKKVGEVATSGAKRSGDVAILKPIRTTAVPANPVTA